MSTDRIFGDIPVLRATPENLNAVPVYQVFVQPADGVFGAAWAVAGMGRDGRHYVLDMGKGEPPPWTQVFSRISEENSRQKETFRLLNLLADTLDGDEMLHGRSIANVMRNIMAEEE